MFSDRAAPAGFVVPSGTRARSPGIHSWVNGRRQRLREDGFRDASPAVDGPVGGGGRPPPPQVETVGLPAVVPQGTVQMDRGACLTDCGNRGLPRIEILG